MRVGNKHMVLTVILLYLAIQRCFHFESCSKQYDCSERYYLRLKERFGLTTIWQGFSGFGIIILPLLLISYILVAFLICHLLTIVGYYFLTVAVLWVLHGCTFFNQGNSWNSADYNPSRFMGVACGNCIVYNWPLVRLNRFNVYDKDGSRL